MEIRKATIDDVNNDEYGLEIMGEQLIDVRYIYSFSSCTK